MKMNEDIFDRIMKWPGLRKLEPFYRKYKEVLLYLFFGGLTFLVSIGSYAGFNIGMGINELIANVISWIFAVAFAYITNKIWVFSTRGLEFGAFLAEIFKFFGGRVFTLVVEEVILYVFITRMQFNSMLVKVIAQVVVIVLNYLISKLFVFKKNR
ncbi:MAG: GtrA family protein [Lachnospiraceae bacterium]|nr:GtrA family protein [Lachnospiraceae bacterium]